MRVEPNGTVVLSAWNLRTLLVKLGGYPAGSACAIADGETGLIVRAEPDDVHYGSRGYGPGTIHPETEAKLGLV